MTGGLAGWDQVTLAAVKSVILVDLVMVGQEGVPKMENTTDEPKGTVYRKKQNLVIFQYNENYDYYVQRQYYLMIKFM